MKSLFLQSSKLPYIGNFSRRGILAKMSLGWCAKFSLSPIFAISRTLNEDVWYGIFFAVFLAISGRSGTQRKLNPREKCPIYGIMKVSTSYNEGKNMY